MKQLNPLKPLKFAVVESPGTDYETVAAVFTKYSAALAYAQQHYCTLLDPKWDIMGFDTETHSLTTEI